MTIDELIDILQIAKANGYGDSRVMIEDTTARPENPVPLPIKDIENYPHCNALFLKS